MLSSRLSFQNYAGIISAPDDEISHVRDPSGNLLPFQQSYDLKLEGTFMHLDLTAEWYLKNYFYVIGGINFAINLSKSVSIYNRILIPDNYFYPDGSRVYIPNDVPKSLNSINFLRLGIFTGVGFIQSLSYQTSVFIETIYNLHLGNIIDDGIWGINQLALQFGIRYRI